MEIPSEIVMKSVGAGLFETGQQVAVAVAASWQQKAQKVEDKSMGH